MSRKMAKFSTQLKTRLVLEVLREEKTLNEIASANNINPKNLQNWKKIFLENAEVAMEPAKAVKEYKDEVSKLKIEVGEYAKKVGELTLEKEWAVGKLKSLDSSYKKELIDRGENIVLSVVKQCKLINYNRSNLFYTPMINFAKVAIKEHIKKVFEEIPSYGYMKVYHQLIEDGFIVSPNTVQTYRRELGLQAVLAVRAPNTSWADKQHPKYSYKIRGLDIVRANQVWSTDITYCI